VKGALLLLLAFLLGAATGALGLGIYQARTGWWGPRRDAARFQQFVLKRLTRELDLRTDQRQQVEAILRESGEEFARLREEIRPRFREIRSRTRDRIRALLDPGQQERFEALTQQWERQAEWRYGRPLAPEEKASQGP
jgi:Spy/CpxP family protein refolding chaperone